MRCSWWPYRCWRCRSREAEVVPAVPAAGVGTKAALESPQCGDDGKLAYPYPQRVPCTAPLKNGSEQRRRDDDGRHQGLDQDRAVPRVRTQQQDADAQPTRLVGADRPCHEPARVLRGLVPRLAGGARRTASTLWGRELEFVTVNADRAPTKPRNAPTRSTVAEKKPFAVVVQRPGHRRWRPGVRGRARGEEDHRVLRRRHQRGSRPAGAVPVPRRLRQQRGRGEHGDVRGAPAQGRDREVVG